MHPPVYSELPPGTLLDHKFRVVRTIGVGGMGAVYEVTHELTKHRRALKVLHPQYSGSMPIVTRFLREASAAGRIGNPHIVETFDAGYFQTGAPYIVMELLSGQPLDRVLSERGRLDFDEAIEYVKQACQALQAAHDAGIVHRDIKPDNLFISAGPFVKILDFGISKFDPTLTGGQQLTQVGTTMGTPYYMSPEQVRGDAQIDARTDVYSLSAVLYECVTGHKPFTGQSTQEIAVLIHVGSPPPLSSYRSDVPVGFEQVVARGMAVDPQQRYPSARAFADALASVRPAAQTRLLFPSRPGTAPALSAPPTRDLAAEVSAAKPSRWMRPRVAWLFGLVAVGLLGLALALVSLHRPSITPDSEALPSASVSAKTAEHADEGPEVLSVVDSEQGMPTAVEEQAPEPARPPRVVRKKPPAPVVRTRAREHGLAEENPFGQ